MSEICSNLGSLYKSVSCINAVSTLAYIIIYTKDMYLQGITSTHKCNTRCQMLDKIYHVTCRVYKLQIMILAEQSYKSVLKFKQVSGNIFVFIFFFHQFWKKKLFPVFIKVTTVIPIAGGVSKNLWKLYRYPIVRYFTLLRRFIWKNCQVIDVKS